MNSGSTEIQLLYAIKFYSHYLQFYSPYVYELKNCQELNISPRLHFVFPCLLISTQLYSFPMTIIALSHLQPPASSSPACVIFHCICCSEFLSFHPIPPMHLYWEHLNITCCSVCDASHSRVLFVVDALSVLEQK